MPLLLTRHTVIPYYKKIIVILEFVIANVIELIHCLLKPVTGNKTTKSQLLTSFRNKLIDHSNKILTRCSNSHKPSLINCRITHIRD